MTEDEELHKQYLDVPPIGHLWFCKDYKDIWKKFAPVVPMRPTHFKNIKEPKWFAYFDDGYDSQWMESYHTKKEAVADIKIHRDSFECLIKGKIVK